MTPALIPHRLSPRTRSLLWTLIGVVALAAVIFGLAAVSRPKSPSPTPAVQLPPSETGDELAGRAEAALSSGDTSTAGSLARKALSRDPGNARASRVLTRVERETPAKPSGGGKTPGHPTTPAKPAVVSPVFLSPVDDLTRLLPSAVPGFAIRTVTEQGGDAVVPLDPVPGGSADGWVSRVLIEVHDRGSAAEASTWVTTSGGTLYPVGVSAVDVAGTPGRFGTDGGRLASVLFSRGRFAFSIVATSAGGEAASLRTLVLDVAKTFPTRP